MKTYLRTTGFVLFAATAFAKVVAAEGHADKVDFSADVLPILAGKCYACHGPDEQARQSDLRLDFREGTFPPLSDQRALVKPGDPAASVLFQRLARRDDLRMPPPDSGKQLSEQELLVIERWIEQGARWQMHWSLIKPRRPALPQIGTSAAPRNAIDFFVLAELERRGLQQSAEADKPTLIRRVTLDLTGLPTTPEQVDAFVADSSPMAYENLVDRLLASPHYGERLAIPWLDAARYADTHGYLFDTERSMWRWRDWVIDAFNRNQPFDRFTVEQLAGDLLPSATLSQRVATGFNRNHLINNEAGAIPAEYLVENIVDRVNTTATVWMGLSLACCQCHDHKYDPFTQREYYQLFAFFNTLPEVGLDGLNANAKPLIKAPTSMDQEQLATLRGRVSTAEREIELLAPQIDAGQAAWEATVTVRNEAPRLGLIAHWPLDGTPTDALEPERAAVFEAAPSSYGAGILGKAASLEGLGYLNAGDRFDFSSGDTFSVTAWVRPNTKAGRLTVFSRMQNAKGLFRGYNLQLVNGLPAFFLIHRFPDDMVQVQGKVALEPGRWHHLAVTYDGSGQAAGVKLYLDGQLQKTGVVVDKLTGAIRTEEPFWIGNGHPAAKLKGLIDEVRVYHRVLDGDEIPRLPGLSIPSLLVISADRRNSEQAKRIRQHYLD